MLDDLTIAREEFLQGEGAQEVNIDDDLMGRVEGANKVLYPEEVNRRLPPYRGIDHRQQCRRHIDRRDATHIGRGC